MVRLRLESVIVVNIYLLSIITVAFCSMAITENENYDINFKWTIRNFLNYPAKFGDSIISPDFGSQVHYYGARVEVRASLYPRGRTKEDMVSIYLTVKVHPASALLRAMASYDIAVVGRNGTKLRNGTIKKADEGNLTNGFGFNEFAPLKVMEMNHEEYLPNGHLTLQLDGKVNFRFTNNVSKIYAPEFARQTLTRLFKEEIGSDIMVKTIHNKERVFRVHKGILSVRSNYLKTLIELKPEQNELDLSGQMNGDELGDLMEYIYLGSTSNLSKTCKTLFKLAPIYGFPELKELGELALVDQLTPDNAWDMMQFAHKHGAAKLKKQAATIVAKNIRVH